MIDKIIHYNRDENSFTARLFEKLVIKFEDSENDKTFKSFTKTLSHACGLKDKEKECALLTELSYVDSMLFLENWDIYGYCKNHDIAIDLDENNIDKTEFDFVIIGKTKDNKFILIAFEVKCFTDLKFKEIERQNKLLEIYKKANLFSDFFHFALISYENKKNGDIPEETLNAKFHNYSIITWDDIKDKFIDYTRIKKEIEFNCLYKKIHIDGDKETKRKLINI